MGIRLELYQNDMVMVRHKFMCVLFEEKKIGATAAIELLKAAERHDRVEDLESHLSTFASSVGASFYGEGAEGNPAEHASEFRSQVMRFKGHWLLQMKHDNPLDNQIPRP